MKNKEQIHQEIEQLWEKIVALFDENFNKEKERLVLKLDTRKKLPKISIEKKKTRTQTQGFEVSYDGKRFSTNDYSATDVFLRFIKEVGVKRVEDLKLLTNKGELLVREEPGNPEKTRAYVDDRYVYTKTATSSKLNTIQVIADLLNLKINKKYL